MADIQVIVYPEPQHNVSASRLYSQQTAQDISTPPETNVHFLGRFAAPPLQRFAYQLQAGDVPPSQVNPHFVGRYAVPALQRFAYQLQPNDRQPPPPQPETNPHFVGRYRPALLRGWPGVRANPATDFIVAVVQPETNPHFVGRYTVPHLGRLIGWTSNIAADQSSPFVPSPTPNIPPVPISRPMAQWAVWITEIARTLNLVLGGKNNSTTTLTLVPNAVSTMLFDSRIGAGSFMQLAPRTPSAAAALASGQVYTLQSLGQATIYHPASSALDQTFSVLIVG